MTRGHDLIYLIIPIVCFLVIAFMVWALTGYVRDETLNCGTRDLDVILSVLMTSGYDRSALKIQGAGKTFVLENHVFLKMTFQGSQVLLEVPIAPRGALRAKEDVISALGRIGLDVRESADGDGLQCDIDGPPSHAVAVITEIVDPLIEGPFELEVHAHDLDHDVIEQAFAERRPGEPLPIAATHGSEPPTISLSQTRWLRILADLLLLPIPFVIAQLQFGYLAATWTLIVTFVAREILGRVRGRTGISGADGLKPVALGLAGATLVTRDPLYLQLIPTVLFPLMAIGLFYVFIIQDPPDDADELDPKYRKRFGHLRWILGFVGVAALLGAAAWNEYMRTHFTLDTWVWFIAFVRVEVLVGLIGSMLSAALIYIYSVSDDDPNDGPNNSGAGTDGPASGDPPSDEAVPGDGGR